MSQHLHHLEYSSLPRPSPIPNAGYSSYHYGDVDDVSVKHASTNTVPRQPNHLIVYKKSRSPIRLALASVGLAAGVVIALAVPIAILLAYIFALNSYYQDGLYIVTGAKSNRIIAITGALGTVAGQVGVPIMSIMGTIAAARWWAASHGGEIEQRPTPLHGAITMSVLGGANVRSMARGLKVLFGQARTVACPSFVKMSILLLFWTLSLHYAIAAVDLAFHLTIEPFTIIQHSFFGHENTSQSLFSRPFNQTKCDDWRTRYANSSAYVRNSCGTQNGSNNAAYLTAPEYLRSLSNSSDTYSVAWTDDGTAIMVPGNTGNLSYSASTMGVKTTCQSITKQCLICSPTTFKADNGTMITIEYCKGVTPTSEAQLYFKCPSTTAFNTTTDSLTTPYAYGILNTTTGNLAAVYSPSSNLTTNIAPTNPFTYGFVAESYAYAGINNTFTGSMIGNTGFVQWGHQGGLNVLYCNVEVLTTKYRFTPPTQYTLLPNSSQLAPLNMTQLYAGNGPSVDYITPAIDGMGASSHGGQTYADAAGQRISRVMVAMAAVLHDATPIIEAYGTPVEGARFHLPLLTVFVLLVVILALTAFLVGCKAFCACLSVRTPAQAGAKSQLMTPYGLWAKLYDDRTDNSEDALSGDKLKIFRPETEADRLRVIEAWDNRAWHIEAQR